MKKDRAARDGAASKATTLPPPIPEFDNLDALAADATPTAEAAWWISHQISEHVFTTIAHDDRRTGDPLPRPLTEILRDLRDATSKGSRPFPHDRLLMAADFTADSVAYLLRQHRNRTKRVHEQLPLHQLRELDTRSMAWLAHRPGRNIREKLSGRSHALGVKRDMSADTTENRLLRSFAKLLVRRASSRLEYRNAYHGTPEDVERVRRLEEFVRLCDDRMRRSELAEVPTLTRLQPNNVLLSDPHYSRVFRAWKWLRDDEEALRQSWVDTFRRIRILLCWMVAAQVVTHERVVVADTLGRVLTGRGDEHDLGVEVLGAETVGSTWFRNPPLHFLVLPKGDKDAAYRIRLSLEEEFILVHVACLGGRGLLVEESVSALPFEIRPSSDRLQPQRGIGIAIEGLETSLRGADHTFADLAGLRLLATQMARQILQRCIVNPNVKRREQTATKLPDGARLGIELGTASLRVSAEQNLPLMSAPWALALDLPGEAGGVDWLEGRADRELALGAAGRSLRTTGDVLDADEQADAGMIALATERMLGSLASELQVPTDARVAYAVPDAVDEFSQRSLRIGFGGSFHRPVPVWRSVAALMAWASDADDRGPRPDESVVVVDTEFGGVSLTVLTARYDEKLKRAHPLSRGIYWERKPPLPPDEQLETLGWPHVLRAYAQMLVKRELNTLDPEVQERVVEDLLRSGKIDALVARGGSILVQISSNATPHFVEFFEDSAWFDSEVSRWVDRLDQSVKKTLSEPKLGKVREILIGGPCDYQRLQGTRRQSGRIKKFIRDKNFGFIIPDEGGGDVFFHINSVQVPDGVLLRQDLDVEFDVSKGKKGPEAQRVTVASPLAAWLRRKTLVTSLEIASGARECLLRLDTGSLTWREWLPELSLEVVRDGHFGELPLLNEGTFVDPFLGDAIQFTVPEHLTLGRGHRWFSFPLLVGRQGRRPIAWEARLDSPAFPLDHDVPARLQLSYRYGIDNSYELTVEPTSEDDTTFKPVKAKWVKGGEAATTTLTRKPLHREIKPWEQSEAAEFVEATQSLHRLGDEKYAKFLFAVTRKGWSEGRNLATAPASVQSSFPRFRGQLLNALPNEPHVDDIPPALEVLALLHEDAPPEVIDRILQLDDIAGDKRISGNDGRQVPLYQRTATMLAMLVGDGLGERAKLLQRLLDRLRCHGQGDNFDPQLTGLTMRALGNAAWRHPAFIGALAATPGGAALVIAQCRRSLQNLLGRVPIKVSSNDDGKKVARLYGAPFRDACELLLALMAVDPMDPVVAPLHTGSPSADGFAKLVRQLDARLASLGATPQWRVRLHTEVPQALHRMSPVAYALNTYLVDGAGTNLVRVESAKVD